MKDILIQFGLPAFALLLCFILLVCGINGEVKAMMAMIIGWIARTGISKGAQIKI